MRAIILSAVAALAVSSCATVSKFTIENRLEELGLSSERAGCMSDELENRLTDSELSEFARFTVSLTARDNQLALLDALSSIQNAKIARAVGASGLVCILRG